MENILIIDDDEHICVLLSKFFKKNNFEPFTANSAEEAIPQLKKRDFDVVITDYRLPDTDGLDMIKRIKILNQQAAIIVITGYSDVRIAVNTLKHGAFEYVTKPLYPDEILVTVKEAIKHKKNTVQQPITDTAAKKLTKQPPVNHKKFIVGPSEQSGSVAKHIELIAPTNMSVIIVGETGTGKEYVANAIHHKSKRSDGPFVAVDCGALPKELAGSELFGHVKGAFTGALNEKTGSFELASGGTLFLDEIGNLTYENQIKLLRVIQERSIKKLGGNKAINVDVRIIVATNDDLKKLVREGEFREDLFHRLNEFKIELSPIRERNADIPVYANHFLQLANQQLEKEVKGFDEDVIVRLKQYHWHGNLRELQNVVKRAVLLEKNATISAGCLPAEILNPSYHAYIENEELSLETLDLKSVTERAERKAILAVLDKTGNNKSKAAEILKVDRKTLYNKLEAYGIEK